MLELYTKCNWTRRTLSGPANGQLHVSVTDRPLLFDDKAKLAGVREDIEGYPSLVVNGRLLESVSEQCWVLTSNI